MTGRSIGLLVMLLAALCLGLGRGVAGTPSIEVVGTLFRVTMASGRILTSPELIGALIEVRNEAGRTMTVRIDAVARDPTDPDGDVWLHRLSVRNPGTEGWHELCGPASDGAVGGFPLAGSWTKDGRHLHASSGLVVTCASGAIGKCVRFGYKPWAVAKGQPLWDYHQACVRMVTADYGGDGTSHTRDGTLIDFSDRLGIQRPQRGPASHTLSFEAAWGPDGAVCVRRTRIPELLSVEELARNYSQMVGKIGPDCSEAVNALIWNRS